MKVELTRDECLIIAHGLARTGVSSTVELRDRLLDCATLVRAEIYDFDHDMYGNPTSHFTLWKGGHVIHRTKRRVQCGYDNNRADGALAKAKQLTDLDLTIDTPRRGSRSEGAISVDITVNSA